MAWCVGDPGAHALTGQAVSDEQDLSLVSAHTHTAVRDSGDLDIDHLSAY